jgi:hypothetical protein
VFSEEHTIKERAYLRKLKSVFYNQKEGGISMPPSFPTSVILTAG